LARKAEIILDFQNVIETPPIAPQALYGQACSNDGATIDAWKEQWIAQIRANKKTYGTFSDKSVGQLHGSGALKPAIIAGAGPSLAYNADQLKNRGGIPLISCLHNFHFMEDRGIAPDYYVTLDAGEVTIGEVSEGGSKTEEEYWALTEKRTLLAFIGTHPKLLEKWRGKVLFFNCPVASDDIIAATEEKERFNMFVGTGGNVLGACLYIAKGILGANPIAFVGADFSFGYNRRFHAWESKYDAHLGNVVKMIDVYGNKVLSWQSYANFKSWFDFIAIKVPGLYINCTEGGTFGAYPEGNIAAVKQMELAQFLSMYQMHEHLREQCQNPGTEERKLIF
jgi:hypothetical protein